ncbi:MAG: GNAT family N-acetyltransferase [Methanoregulaceae archaeon]|nr:GNAT family N-acetyltransferase [Methanoregulaceae archaeon]
MNIELRPATDADWPFIESVFVSVRAPEFEAAGLSGEALANLLAMQFRAQRSHYARAYPEGEDRIIVRDGVDVGEWITAELPDELRLVDISLLPDYRGQGVGTLLVSGFAERARALQKPVVLHVEMNNPARRLYERFGFEIEEEVGMYYRMRCQPA